MGGFGQETQSARQRDMHVRARRACPSPGGAGRFIGFRRGLPSTLRRPVAGDGNWGLAGGPQAS